MYLVFSYNTAEKCSHKYLVVSYCLKFAPTALQKFIKEERFEAFFDTFFRKNFNQSALINLIQLEFIF
jgi:hypothetical protein